MSLKGCEKNGTIVQCLMKYWMKALDEAGRTDSCRHMQSVFAEGLGAIDVRNEAFGQVITATDFPTLEAQWEAVTENIETMRFEQIGEMSVDVTPERVVIRFELVADGEMADGSPITPQPHWRGEHEWRQFDGEWRIVCERLKSL